MKVTLSLALLLFVLFAAATVPVSSQEISNMTNTTLPEDKGGGRGGRGPKGGGGEGGANGLAVDTSMLFEGLALLGLVMLAV